LAALDGSAEAWHHPGERRGAVKVAAAVVVAAALVLPAAQAAERNAASPVLSFDFSQAGVIQLAWIDPLTLTKLDRPNVVLGRYTRSWSFSPGRSTLAIAAADAASDFKLRYVSIGDMRLIDELDLGDAVDAMTWLRPDRLLGLIGSNSSELAVVDPTHGALVRTVPLPGSPRQVERVPGGLVLLLATPGAFAPPVLAVADPEGGLRTVTLDRISIGEVGLQGRSPGFAVDRAHRRAFIVGGDLTIAEVNLDTLAVKYHGGTKRALAKFVVGWVRQALWLGHDLLAVSGYDRSFTAQHALGLRMVNTRIWKTRVVDRWVDDIERGSGNALFVAESDAAPWLRYVYTLRGKLRYRTQVGAAGGSLALVGPYGYVCFQGTLDRVVSAGSGRTLRVARDRHENCPQLLHG
jgi:hypothetical protein